MNFSSQVRFCVTGHFKIHLGAKVAVLIKKNIFFIAYNLATMSFFEKRSKIKSDPVKSAFIY